MCHTDLLSRVEFLPEHGRVPHGFLQVEQVIELLDREISARELQIKRFRDRDRTLPQEPEIPFDAELHELIAEAAHQRGAQSMDHHVAWCIELRDELRRRLFKQRLRAVD